MKYNASCNIFSMRTIWKQIEASAETFKLTQSYEYYRYLFITFYSRLTKLVFWRMVFHYFEDGKDKCIIPLVVSRKHKEIRTVSYYGRLDYDDIISTTTSPVFLRNVVKCLCNKYPNYTLIWRNMHEESIIYSLLKDLANSPEPCVAISLPLTYDKYFSSLSKNQRQNIRTSYNRLDKDNINVTFECYDAFSPIEKSLWKNCEKMYEERHDLRRKNFLYTYLDRIRNPYHYILTNHPHHKIFVLMANDLPITYMAGLYDEDNKIYYVPRLCIDYNYARYSPGIILVNETIKFLISKNIQVLDLMAGNEIYKLAMGGIVNNNYQLKIATSELLNYVHTT